MEQLLVEAPNPDSAIALVDELKDFHAELVPGPGDRCEVQIDLGDARESQIAAALSAVERWLLSTGIDTANVKLDDRAYVVESRTASSSGRPPEPNRATSLYRRDPANSSF